MNWSKFPEGGYEVKGLAWFDEDKPSLSRLPKRLKDTFREPVWDLAQCPAGGRICFRTDSTEIGVRAQCADATGMPHMTSVGQNGFDVYADGLFRGSVSPDETGKIDVVWRIAAKSEPRDVTIHMPLYKAVEISEIGISDGASVKPPTPFAVDKPVVFYGSSITQGGCASTPGTTYQNFISRWLNVDIINLGFSGNGLGEPELAEAIREIDSSCIVLDHWANIHEKLGENLPVFVGAIRKVRPETPIIVVGPFFYASDIVDDKTHAISRVDAQNFVRRARRSGDKNVHFFNGLKMINPDMTFGLVDGVHCNSLGFYLAAKGFTPFLRRVLGL